MEIRQKFPCGLVYEFKSGIINDIFGIYKMEKYDECPTHGKKCKW